MSQFISPGVLAQLRARSTGKSAGCDGNLRESRVEVIESAGSRDEPSSASRIRVARVRDT